MFPDGVRFFPDKQGDNYGFNTDAQRGADTFRPFSNGEVIELPSTAGTYKHFTLKFENPYKKKILCCYGYAITNSPQVFMWDFINNNGYAVADIFTTDTTITITRTPESTSATKFRAWIALA